MLIDYCSSRKAAGHKEHNENPQFCSRVSLDVSCFWLDRIEEKDEFDDDYNKERENTTKTYSFV